MIDLNHFGTLSEAQQYAVVSGDIITSNVMRMLLVKHKLYSFVSDNLDDISRAVTDSIKTSSKFNFIVGDHLGDLNLEMIDALSQLYPSEAEKITALKTELIGISNVEYHPYGNVTQLQFDLAKGLVVESSYSYELANNSVDKTIVKIKLNSTPVEPASVYIASRISKDDVNYTEWQRVASLGSVRNDIETYSAIVAGTTASFRQLKIVSTIELSFTEV